MDNTTIQEDHLRLLDSVSKCIASAIGVLYLVGFVAVSAHLSRYGVSGFSVLQLQYLVAGVWVLGPPIFVASVQEAAERFETRIAPNISRTLNWRAFLILGFITGVPFGVFVGILSRIPGVLEEITWGIGIRLFLFYFVIVIFGQLLWMSWRSRRGKESRLANREATPLYLTLLLTTVLAYTVWFAARIYPLIPFSLGGGRPLTIAFIEGEKKFPVEIKMDTASNRSIPYKLLMSTDRYYVVLTENAGESSMEIGRDSVAGIIVLEDTSRLAGSESAGGTPSPK